MNIFQSVGSIITAIFISVQSVGQTMFIMPKSPQPKNQPTVQVVQNPAWVPPTPIEPIQPKQVPIVDNRIDCTGPDGKHLRITQEECDNFNNAWKKTKIENQRPQQLNKPTQPQYQAPQTYSCTVSYPCTGSVETYQLTTADCLSFQNLARSICTPAAILPVPTYEQYKPTPTVTQADVDQYNNKISQCQNDVARKYSDLIQSCSARFGSSSAAEACRQINTQERDQQYKNCGSKI